MRCMTATTRRAYFNRSLVAAIFSAVLLLAAPMTDAFADSLREVAERVARQHDGKVIAAREVQRNGRRFYEIRILTRDGVVRTIRVPADDRQRGPILANTTPGLDAGSPSADVSRLPRRTPEPHRN